MEATVPQHEIPPVMTMQRMADIAHAIYGIPINDEPAELVPLADLRAKGYTEKEMLSVIRADVFRQTTDRLAEEMTTQPFIPATVEWLGYAGSKTYTFTSPEDLKTIDGQTSYPRLKLYVETVIGNTARSLWNETYQHQHPNAAAILNEIGRDIWNDSEEVELFDALDLGLNIILATQKYIDEQPTGQCGPSFMASMPTLYKLASQNVETTGSPEIITSFALEDSINPHECAVYQQKLREAFAMYPDDALTSVKSAMLNDLLENEIFRGSEAKIPILEEMDTILSDRTELINYLSGDRPDRHASSSEYPFDLRTVTRTSYWIENGSQPRAEAAVREALLDLELTMRDYALSDTFFTALPQANPDVVQVKFVPAATNEAGRPKEKLFREEIIAMGGVQKAVDRIEATQPTTRCAAMNMAISPNAQTLLGSIRDAVGFTPRRMNGIDVVALFSLWSVHPHAN